MTDTKFGPVTITEENKAEVTEKMMGFVADYDTDSIISNIGDDGLTVGRVVMGRAYDLCAVIVETPSLKEVMANTGAHDFISSLLESAFARKIFTPAAKLAKNGKCAAIAARLPADVAGWLKPAEKISAAGNRRFNTQLLTDLGSAIVKRFKEAAKAQGKTLAFSVKDLRECLENANYAESLFPWFTDEHAEKVFSALESYAENHQHEDKDGARKPYDTRFIEHWRNHRHDKVEDQGIGDLDFDL